MKRYWLEQAAWCLRMWGKFQMPHYLKWAAEARANAEAASE